MFSEPYKLFKLILLKKKCFFFLQYDTCRNVSVSIPIHFNGSCSAGAETSRCEICHQPIACHVTNPYGAAEKERHH